MEHMLLKAATTATEESTFEAVISTASVDRDGDIVEPSAMVNALTKWAAVGKLVPLAWVHKDGTGSGDVIGHIDPSSAQIVGAEVVVKGWIDQSVERGVEAWRLVKSGTLSFSYGFLFDTKSGATQRPGGGYHIKELDIYEISVVPIAPANNDTRVLSWKALAAARQLEEAERVAEEVTEQQRETVEHVKAEIESTRDALLALEMFEPDELAGMKSGEIKAAWTASYINDLPDGSFLYIEPGGNKDSEGKTAPRSLRHFPYKDANGAVDMPHLRNALSRIPQSNLPQTVKDTLTARAQRLLDNSKAVERTADELKQQADDVALQVATHDAQLPESVATKGPSELEQIKQHLARLEELVSRAADVTGKEEEANRPEPRPVDTLRRQADEVAMKVATRGLELDNPRPVVEQPKREADPQDLDLLKQRMHDDMVAHLQGVEDQ
jgi:HK97 family phage prohead protease